MRNGLAALKKQQKDFTCRLAQPVRGKSVDLNESIDENVAGPHTYLKRNEQMMNRISKTNNGRYPEKPKVQKRQTEQCVT